METETRVAKVRERLRDLDTKAYYLLVALSFLYFGKTGTHAASLALKLALTLTCIVAVIPV
jgi:hypothetical protein